ncbi:MAG TPA: choice-of-anchor J domain-containing protein, partial [Candidatus Cloacimonadota bacterium]|nr:choice-of-anchor J domain-containing protein [Candidatus Cloacimonadota bacterium]
MRLDTSNYCAGNVYRIPAQESCAFFSPVFIQLITTRNPLLRSNTAAVTPPVGPMVPNAELKFDYRFVNYSGFPANATTLSANDKIDVQVSTDGGNTYTTVYTIDQSNHVTSNAFANTRVDLSAYETGSIMVKFLLTWGAGDYYVDIDNVMIRETPSAPLFGISPTSKDFGQVEVGTTATQVFTISNTGVGVLELGDIEITEGSAQYSI